MKILVVGAGGREHALAWKAAQSQAVDQVFVAPGNAGTADESKVRNIDIGADNIAALLQFAISHEVDLTIVGPEGPLVAGITDRFTEQGLRCFGPSQQAAQLEGSKSFTKDFLARHGIPTAAYQTFSDVELACGYIKKRGVPIVIKADGLAAGKGVTVAQTLEQAFAAIRACLEANKFGDAGHSVVIEDFLAGEEASFICMVDGENALPLATSQDHKTRDNGDLGPNTGGMGAYSPAPVITTAVHTRIMNEIIEPTVTGLALDGNPYTGFLYAGVMIDAQGAPSVVEYNCRLGDPETQPIMMRLKSDLVSLCNAALDKRLNEVNPEWDKRAALGVVMAAGGYPDDYRKGDIITGLEKARDEVKVFHAGTKKHSADIVTSGGRVLCVTALATSITQAQQLAYQYTKQINWAGCYSRSDIGYRAVARENS